MFDTIGALSARLGWIYHRLIKCTELCYIRIWLTFASGKLKHNVSNPQGTKLLRNKEMFIPCPESCYCLFMSVCSVGDQLAAFSSLPPCR